MIIFVFIPPANGQTLILTPVASAAVAAVAVASFAVVAAASAAAASTVVASSAAISLGHHRCYFWSRRFYVVLPCVDRAEAVPRSVRHYPGGFDARGVGGTPFNPIRIAPTFLGTDYSKCPSIDLV